MEHIRYDDKIRLADGGTAILSTIALGTKFETMLLTPDGEELAVEEDYNEAQAIATFNHLKDYYHTPELKGKYKKLAEDLKAAMAYGLEHAGTDDGGTCNFDSPTLRLPKWNRKLVEIAAKTAGTGCFIWNLWGSKSFVFSVRGVGQGYTRTKAAEAASRFLKELGYDAGMYYQVD